MPNPVLQQKLTQFLLFFTLLNIIILWGLCVPLWAVTKTAPTTLVAWIFTIAMYVGQLSLFAIIGIFLIPYILLRCGISRWVIFVWAIIAASGVCILLGADSFVYRFFHWHVNDVILGFTFSGKFKEIGDLSATEIEIIMGVVTGGLLAQTLLSYLLWRHINRKEIFYNDLTLSKTPPIILSSLMGLLFLSYSMYAAAQANNYRPIINNAYLLPYYFTPSLNPLLVKIGILTPQQIENYPIELPLFISTLDKKLSVPLHPLEYKLPPQPLNVVLILIDTWRFDMINKDVAPHIAKFIQQSTQFNNHYSGGTATGPGVFTLLYSLPYPYWNLAINAEQPAPLFTELKKQQYQLGIYASAPLDLPAFTKNVFATLPEVRVTTPGATPWQRDQQITQDSINFLKQRAADKKPFFNFIFYDSVHAYSLPPDFELKFTPILKTLNRVNLTPDFDPIPFENLYKNTVYYVDGLVEQVLLTLQQTQLLDNTLVIITADHGEEFNDNKLGYWGHSSNFTDYQAKVPFIVYWPHRSHQTINYMTSHYDLVPTLMHDVLGIKNPYRDYSIGHSLFTGVEKPFVISSSYGYTAIIEPKTITTFIPGAGHRITDKHLHPLPDSNYDHNTIRAADILLQQYSVSKY